MNSGYDSNDAGGWSWNGNVNLRFIPTASLEIQRASSRATRFGPARRYCRRSVAEATTARDTCRHAEPEEFSLQTRVNYILAEDVSADLHPAADVGWRLSRARLFAQPRTFDFIRYGSIAARCATTPR